MSDEFDFQPAIREGVHIIIALAGASGSGKTKTALELAVGLAGGDESAIAMIDTEAKRGLHYARTRGETPESAPGKYGFRHADMQPPFRPERFERGIDAAANAGFKVLIIDSFSHEYDGEGGIMDWATELEEGTLKPGKTLEDAADKQDGWKAWEQKPVKSPGNWKEPKAAHKHLIQTTVLQARCHIIFCLRAEEKIKIGKDQYGKATVEPMGWMPICEKRFMYEMTMSLTLRPDAPGIPQFDLPHKMQDQHRPFFPEGQRISREAGAKLAMWAAGGTPDPAKAYAERVRAAIGRATDHAALKAWWDTPAEQSRLTTSGLTGPALETLLGEVTARLAELKGNSAQ